MKQKSLFKGLVALTLSAAMLLSVTGCDDNTTPYQANDTDLSSLSVTEPSPFYFGTKDRDVNGLVEVHDPSTFKDPNSEYYYCYFTDFTMSGNPNRGMGIQIRRSTNLTDWEYVGHALDDASIEEARVLPDGSYNTGFWAPSITYVDGEYRLYYSVSTFGAATSRIYLAVSSSPEGPFTNRGLVVDTWKNTSGSGPNGIDPYYVEDKDGNIVPRIKISENVAKITTPCFKEVWRLFDNETGKAIADVITLHDEVIDESKPYVLFDPEHIWKRKKVENFRAVRLRKKYFEGGKCLTEERPLDEIRQYCKEQVDSLWEEVTRFENPHRYYVDLSQKLWDEKNRLLSEYAF